jgi:hypothetical protein
LFHQFDGSGSNRSQRREFVIALNSQPCHSGQQIDYYSLASFLALARRGDSLDELQNLAQFGVRTGHRVWTIIGCRSGDSEFE